MLPRIYLITGASKGIGIALSERLTQRGHSVVGIARHVKNVHYPGKLVSLGLSNDGQSQTILQRSNLVT